RMLQIAQGNLQGAIADQIRSSRIGRELGMTLAEYFSEVNLGEMLCQAGDAHAASPHVRRAIEIERAHPDVGTRPVALLLWARLLAWQGDRAPARAALEEVRALDRAAAASGNSAGILTASEQVLVDTVELATRTAEPVEI